MPKLKFSPANVKLKKLYKVPELATYLTNKRKIYSLDLVAGRTCPMAKECLSYAVHTPDGTRIKDGKHTEFRCYAASTENQYPGVLKLHEHNTRLLRDAETVAGMVELLESSLPENIGILRYHSSGDFFNQNYFEAMIRVANNHPNILFYFYTKRIQFIVRYRHKMPNNVVWTASKGGKQDNLIDQYKLRQVVVVGDEKTAEESGLDVDDNDEHASRPDIRHNSFALVIHGTQPAGSEFGKIVNANNRKKGKYVSK